MPMVVSSVFSIIAVTRMNDFGNLKAILLQWYHRKQMRCKLQNVALKWKCKSNPLKVKSLFVLWEDTYENQFARIKASHMPASLLIKWRGKSG